MVRGLAVSGFAVALLVLPQVALADDGPKAAETKDTSLAGTLYAEAGLLFNIVHIPEATADAGFGVRVAAGFQFHRKLRVHLAYRSLSNENKDQPGSEENYSDLSLGLGLALDGKHFFAEGELTRANISGSGFDEGGLGGGVYLVAAYPLTAQFKIGGRVGAYFASVDVPSRGGARTALWGLVGFALIYQGAPWASGE